LYGKPEKGRARRLEVKGNQFGRLTIQDRVSLGELLSKLVYQDTYLYSEVDIDDQPGRCLWHLISGGVFPLESVHAEFTLFYFDSLQPTMSSQSNFEEYFDAPALWEFD
jgi:hypothetical protein